MLVAHATNVLLAPALARAPRRRMLSLLVPPVLVARDPRVSVFLFTALSFDNLLTLRLIDSCSCNGTESGAAGDYPHETDFTTKA